MRRIPLLGALVAAAVLVPAAVSQAATVSYESGALVYRGAGTEANAMHVSTYQPWDDPNTYLTISDAVGVAQSSATNLCTKDESIDALLCQLDPNRPVKLYGNAGKDRITIYFHGVPESIPFTLSGGDGNDDLEDASGTEAATKLFGDGGDDKLQGHGGNDYLDGGEGGDDVDGGAGNDQVHGSGGNDIIRGDHYQEAGADVMDGGPGLDRTEDWDIPEKLDDQPAIDVTLDGVANDGRPGEGDNVISIEKFEMYVVGRLVGTNGPEELNIYNPANRGPSTLIGNGGNDELYGYDFDDTVDGGAGNDHVEGGLGNDTVTGGPGQDVIYGDATASRCTWFSCKVPFGNDVINARDGEADSIDCGLGTDKAFVDAVDTVANCETVSTTGKAPGGGNNNGGTGGGGGLSVTLAKVKLRTLAARGLKIRVPCASACSISGTITLKGRKVGGGRGTALKAGTATATLRLTARGKRAIKRLRRATLKVRVTMTPADGATLSTTRTLKLKR